MEKDLVSLNVSPDMVLPVLEKAVQSAIVDQIGDCDDLIRKMVALALRAKVNAEGYVDKSSYHNDYDFLELITNKAIRKAATDALNTWLETNSEKIKKAVLTELKKPSRQKSIASAFADAVERDIKCSWRMDCKIKFKESS